MQSFVIRPMTWPVLKLFSRNPLIRGSDRIESAVRTLAVFLVVIAASCAGILGTAIHDGETQKFLQQAQLRRAVIATAVEDSKPAASTGTTASTVHASWQLNGTGHTGVIGWEYSVKAGEPLQIWVDPEGNQVDQPTSVERATFDALWAALVGWLIVVAAVAEAVVVVCAHARRMRDAQWERDIRGIVNEDGGRTNHSQ